MRIGIVVPAWNVAAYLGETVRAVLAQTHADWRMVVVDDGSTDGTARVAAGFGDSRITLISQRNAGVSAARNSGLATLDPGAEAVLFLDGDDCLTPDALARMVTGLRDAPRAVAAAGGTVRFDGLAEDTMRAPPAGDLVEPLLLRNRFANPGHVLMWRWAVARAGAFRADLTYGEDWEFLVRLAMLGPFARVPGRAPVLRVRVRPGGASYLLAHDPAGFAACLDAIFAIPALLHRYGVVRLTMFRRRAEAESQWVIGRELIRHGRMGAGRPWLRRSVAALPSAKRLALLAAAHAIEVLPKGMRGPFVPYVE